MGHGRMRTTAVALAVLLCVGAAACDDTDTDAGRPHRAARQLVTAGPTTGDLFAYGVVQRDGEPQAGMKVSVLLWPEDGSDSEVGATVAPWQTKPMTTDARGRWSVRIDPDVLPSKYFPADHDFLNYDIDVWSTDHRFDATWSTTNWLLPRPKVWRTDESRPGDSVPKIVLDLGRPGRHAGQIALTDSQGHTERSALVLD